MICHIIRKEILENILSLRFMLSLLLVISLFAMSSFVFVSNYKQQSHDYWNRTNKNSTELSKQTEKLYTLAFYKQSIWRQPKFLSLCAEGFEKYLPNHFKLNVFEMDYPEAKSRTNLMLSYFCDLDWVFITSILLSFVAMVFTYQSICGEKEAGTLRLMLAGTIPRYKVLLGKYFGTMLTLGIPIFLGLLVNLIIVTSYKVVTISAGDWLRIFTIITLLFLYVSIFVLLGIFVSSRTSHSASSMVILLLVWVTLVILIPSFGRIASNTFQKVSTKAERARLKANAFEQIWNNVYTEKYGKNATSINADRNSTDNNPPARARFSNAFTNAENQIFDMHFNQMISQATIGRRFTCISPTAIYRRASEAIANTGLDRFLDFCQQVKRYQDDLKDFIINKDAEDPNSLHLLYPEMRTVRNWISLSDKPVNFSIVPKFLEQEPKLFQSLRLVIWDIGLLAIFNLALLAGSVLSFLRYDVR